MTIPTETYIGGKRYIEGFCLSSETKPTDNIATGSIMTEVNTGKVFFYNATAEAWVEQFSFQT